MTPFPMDGTQAMNQPPEVNVLVVDDVAQNLLALEALLARPGIRVLKAGSGSEALELLLEHDVAMALLDVQMPEIDGFALAELMRGAERTRHIPIIFLTAASQDQQRTFRGYEAGAVDFLYKPLEPHVLASKVAVFVDLYVQRQRLQQQIAEVQRLRKLNEMMTAVLTHDLRTPLMAIALSAEIVHRRGQEENVQKAGQRIKSSSSRMARTIDHMLNFSRIRSGVTSIAPKPSDLGSIGAAVVAEINEVRPSARIDMQCEGDLTGLFDADRMSQVFTNLLGTALEHAGEGSPIKLKLDGSHKDRLNVLLAFPDVLADDVQADLFEPIVAGLGKDGLRSTLGAGLAVVDQGVSAHGGSIVARSNASEGTVFEFLVPRSDRVTR
jgi:two-component system sensor histidine kinase/response regulator